MQTKTYTNIEGLEGFTIKCIFAGNKQDDDNFIKDSAKIISNLVRKEMKKWKRETEEIRYMN